MSPNYKFSTIYFVPSVTSDKSFNYSRTQLIHLKLGYYGDKRSDRADIFQSYLTNNHFPQLH